MNKQMAEMAKDLKECLPNDWYWQKSVDSDTYFVVKHFYNAGYCKIPEGAVVLTRDELDEVLDTCKCAMVVTDDDGEKYVSLDDYDEYTDRLGKIARQRKAKIEYLEKLLDDRCDRCIEQVRKETAEKFAERLKERLDISVNGYSTSEVMSEIEDKIDEIAKEITEGEV